MKTTALLIALLALFFTPGTSKADLNWSNWEREQAQRAIRYGDMEQADNLLQRAEREDAYNSDQPSQDAYDATRKARRQLNDGDPDDAQRTLRNLEWDQQ